MFDAPKGQHGTWTRGISEKGVVVGAYSDADFRFHMYRRSRKGKVKTFDIPGATAQSESPVAINSDGYVAGRADFSTEHGLVNENFVRAPDGTVSLFELTNGEGHTSVVDIAADGTTTGYYTDAGDRSHAFPALARRRRYRRRLSGRP